MMRHSQRGFSLPEVLLALLLLGITFSTLLHCQLFTTQGMTLQWRQAERWQSLRESVQGQGVSDPSVHLQQHSGPGNCQLYQATTDWRHQTYRLNHLICDDDRD